MQVVTAIVVVLVPILRAATKAVSPGGIQGVIVCFLFFLGFAISAKLLL